MPLAEHCSSSHRLTVRYAGDFANNPPVTIQCLLRPAFHARLQSCCVPIVGALERGIFDTRQSTPTRREQICSRRPPIRARRRKNSWTDLTRRSTIYIARDVPLSKYDGMMLLIKNQRLPTHRGSALRGSAPQADKRCTHLHNHYTDSERTHATRHRCITDSFFDLHAIAPHANARSNYRVLALGVPLASFDCSDATPFVIDVTT